MAFSLQRGLYNLLRTHPHFRRWLRRPLRWGGFRCHLVGHIVRPTRDGIHAREYISTTVDLGRRLHSLEFDAQDRLTSTLSPLLQIPIPVLFDPVPIPVPGRGVQLAVARAAAELGTFVLVRPPDWADDLAPFASHIAPLLTPTDSPHAAWVQAARLVEIEATNDEEGLAMWERVKAANPGAIISLRLPSHLPAPSASNVW